MSKDVPTPKLVRSVAHATLDTWIRHFEVCEECQGYAREPCPGGKRLLGSGGPVRVAELDILRRAVLSPDQRVKKYVDDRLWGSR